ncbi:hypothetical protein MMB232_01167 [Brevundimonas subvibrioides]|uniref:polysaccharide pyruvyl transferase family protein n=1 Tax=Brevundimonas subvibrioides TaxID=74313 RepID=UPI0032D57CD4
MADTVLIITRMHTQNAGNEALSKELIIYAQTLFGADAVQAIDRYPRLFESYTVKGLGSAVEAGFDRLARSLIDRFYASAATPPERARPEQVILQKSTQEVRGRLRTLKNLLGVRRRLAAVGLMERKDPEVAVSACADARLILWNPAGEIHPTGNRDQVMRLLLLVRIAQLSGRRTAVINHSLEVEDPELARLVRHVYGAMDYVGVRDAESVRRVAEMEVGPAVESPDLVFLASRIPPSTQGHDGGAIGISINALTADRTPAEWTDLMSGLSTLGRPFLYLTNAMNHDTALARELAQTYGGEVIDHQPGYLDLRTHYARCAVLISSRLHASILALCEGVPVVSIEPSVFKLTAIFDQMNYPIRTESMGRPGWGQRVLANVRRALDEGDALATFNAEALALQRKRIEDGYAPLRVLGSTPAPTDAVHQ